MKRYNLIKLYEVAENIVVNSRDDPKCQTGEAINWGDLHCTSAERYITHDGEIGHRVYIEEASPDCWKFCQYIADQLTAQGYPDVEVKTEW